MKDIKRNGEWVPGCVGFCNACRLFALLLCSGTSRRGPETKKNQWFRLAYAKAFHTQCGWRFEPCMMGRISSDPACTHAQESQETSLTADDDEHRQESQPGPWSESSSHCVCVAKPACMCICISASCAVIDLRSSGDGLLGVGLCAGLHIRDV